MSEVPAKTDLDVTDIFTKGDYKRVSIPWAKTRGYHPNELWYSEKDRTALIVSRASIQARGDFALNEKAFRDSERALLAKQVDAAYVVFAERNGTETQPFGYKSVEDMGAFLEGREPLTGMFGPFWWIDRDTASTTGGYVPEALRPM